MAAKPIIDVQHRGKRFRVDFAAQQKGIAMKYDIYVNNRPTEIGIFAEEVMRWLAEALREEQARPPTTNPCSMEDACRCRDTQNIDCQFPNCQIRENERAPVRRRRPLGR
jgi:hypothetical protein